MKTTAISCTFDLPFLEKKLVSFENYLLGHYCQGMSDEWVFWLNGAEILPIQRSSAEWG